MFEVTGTRPGWYEVALEGHRVQFVVAEGPPDQAVLSPPGSATGDELGTPTIIAISLGGAGAAVAIILTMRRRRRPASFQDLEAKYRKVLEDLDK